MRLPRPILLALALTASILSTSTPAHATWTPAGDVVANGAVDEDAGLFIQNFNTVVAPDAAGGCFVAYFFSNDSIRINRLSGDNGAKLWGPTGVKVNQGGNALGIPVVEPDGFGGCYVAWLDSRAVPTSLYIQRFNASGVPQAAEGGYAAVAPVPVTNILTFAIASSPNARLLIAYWENGGEPLKVVRACIPSNGQVPFIELPGGAVMTTDQGVTGAPLQLFADGTGGGIVVWPSQRASLPGTPGTSRIVANRFDNNGARLWGTEGSVVQAGAGATASELRSFWDGTDLFVCWKHDAATDGVHAQKMNGSGVAQWGTTAAGITVMNQVDTPFDDWFSTVMQPRITPAASGGCWVAWVDGRNWTQPAFNGFQHAQDIYTQRLNSAGVAQLTANGAPADSTPGTTRELQACAGANGELLLAYKSLLFDSGDIFVLRVATAGTPVIPTNIVNKTGNPNTDNGVQEQPTIVPDGFGGLFVVWDDDRNAPNQDVYATHRTATLGTGGPTIALLTPNGGQTLVPGQAASITWSSTLPPTASVRLEFGHDGAPRQNIAAAATNDGSFTWTVPSDGGADFRVWVSDASDGVPEDSSDATFTICSPLPATSTRMHDAPGWVAEGDFNLDGLTDLAFAVNGGVQVMRNRGGGVFDSVASEPTGGAGVGVCSADFNDDGALDLAVAATTGLFVLPGELSAGTPTGTFGPPATLLSGLLRSVETADFNEDGISDLAAVTTTSVQIFLGNGSGGSGDGTFASPVSYAAGGTPLYFTIGDFDEDGIWDLAVANNLNSSNSVSVLLGKGSSGVGSGTFADAVNYPAGTNPRLVVTGDFNEDGITDLAVGANTATGVSILLGQGAGGVGNGTFGAATAYPHGTATRELRVGDVNGDGRADLITGTVSGVRLLLGDGAGSVGDGTFTVGDSTAIGVISAISVNDWVPGAGVEIVAGESGVTDRLWTLTGGCVPAGPTVGVTSPNGGQYLLVGSNQTLQWTKSASVLAVHVDLSRDGGIHWERLASNLTASTFSWTVTEPSTGQARLRVVDANHFGVNDASNANFTIATGPITVLAPNGGEALRGFETVEIRWLSNLGGTVRLQYTVNGGPRQTITASTPNDGSESWIVSDVEAAQAKVFVSTFSGGSPDSSDATFTICRRLEEALPLAGATAFRMATADFNEDGIADLAKVDGDVYVRLGQGSAGVGDGTFGPEVTYPLSAGGFALVTADFNDDGIMDVVAGGGNNLDFFRGLGVGGVGNGAFAGQVSTPLGHTVLSMAVADFNEDGIEDLVATSHTLDRVDILFGNGSRGIGNGTFAAPLFLPVGDSPLVVVVADFNEDGIWDVATANNGSASISILIGRGSAGVGDGTFDAAVEYTAGLGIFNLVAADFDGDDIMDLGHVGGSVASVLRGNGTAGVGDGTFSAPIVTSVPAGITDGLPAIVDLDFDALPDLVVCGSSQQRFGFLLGSATGVFRDAGVLSQPSDPWVAIIGDFLEDGAPDLAAIAGADSILTLLGDLCGGTPGSITLVGPGPNKAAATAAAWEIGSNQTIAWTKSPNVHLVDIEVSRDDGANWETIARNVISDAFSWTVTGPASDVVRLRVSDPSRPGTSDVSDAPQPITGSPVGVEIAPPTAASFSAGWPNPGRDAIRFQLALPSESDVSVDVFDLKGRRIATLARGHLPAGLHTVGWEPDARTAPAGVYFVRARWQDFDKVRTVMRIP